MIFNINEENVDDIKPHTKKEYESNCGPMTHFSGVQQSEYNWLNDPWPWEYAMNREA